MTIDDQIDFLLSSIDDNKPVHFLELATTIHERLRLVVTFIALLELIKRHVLRIQTSGGFNDFIISKREALSEESLPESGSSIGEEDNVGRPIS